MLYVGLWELNSTCLLTVFSHNPEIVLPLLYLDIFQILPVYAKDEGGSVVNLIIIELWVG